MHNGGYYLSSTVAESKNKIFLIIMLFSQFIVCALIIFDVQIARQIIGFLYFTFVPGFIVARILKLYGLNKLETVLFSMGLSVGFLMLLGLLTNCFGFLLGISKPLTLIPLMGVLNAFILVGTIIAYLRSGSTLWKGKGFKLHPSVAYLVILPILSVIGSIYVNTYGDNSILLFMMIAITLVFIIAIFSEKLLPSTFYPLAVLMIAISLLFHSSLVSSYVFPYGSDSPAELFVFKITRSNAYWNSTNPFPGDVQYGRYYSMLSITILPTVYSVLLKIDPTWIFKILFPLIFSFVPVGLYQLWKGYMGKKYAFIAAFFFMSYETFYTEMIGLNRQMIAEIFFIMLLLVIFNEKIKAASKTICFMIFSFGLITSHYGLSEIFLFFISLAFICLFIIKKPRKNIRAAMIVLFFVIMFTWYIYITSSAVFDSILEFGNYVYEQMGDFFNPRSREPEVLRGLGLESPPTIWNAISRVFAYMTEFLIVIGFVSLLLKRKDTHFKGEYFILTFTAMTFLAALIIVPGLANTMNMTRFYHILLFFLAPLCVVGADFLGKSLKRNKKLVVSVLLLIVLVSYFLFQTSFVFEIVGSRSPSVPLSGYRMKATKLYVRYLYIDAYNVFGAQWLLQNSGEHAQIYSDSCSRRNELRAYGMMYSEYIKILSNTTEVEPGGIVYLSSLNVNHETVVGSRLTWNTSELEFLNDLNKVYSNGLSQVYMNMP
ncbi:MAG: hypothetical protein DRI74_07560 [Bacteroidetes bacterium]|nr:MAG: hypothetical protein DRI74_07560 [Bacteroidota bacterium]